MSRCIFLFFFIFIFFLNACIAETESEITEVPKVLIKAHKKVTTEHHGPRRLISEEQIKVAGAQNLGQILSSLGSLKLIDSTANGSQTAVSLRGFGSNATSNTLLVINGIPITNPDLAAPDFNLIPASEIQYIEIIAGSESVLYGDQAVGGVINIHMRQTSTERFGLACSVGSYDERYCYGIFYDHYRGFDLNLFAAHKHSDHYRDHNHYDQSQLVGGINTLYDLGSLRFDWNVGAEEMQYPGSLTAAQVRANRRQANNSSDFFKNRYAFFHLQQEQAILNDWRMHLDLVRREVQGHGVLTAAFNQSRLTYFFKSQFDGKVNKIKIKSGLDIQSDSYQISSLFGSNENTLQKYDVYLIATMPLNDHWLLSLGSRGAEQIARLQTTDTQNTINRALATTLSLSYSLSPEISWYVRRAGSYRFPKADENTFTASGIGSLRTQRGTSYESGVRYQHPHYGSHLDLYRLDLRDEIAFDPTQTPSQPFGSNRNLARTTKYGLSLAFYHQPSHFLKVGGQYNYVHARYSQGPNTGKQIPLVAENILLLNLDYLLTTYWKAYLEAVYTGKQFPANDDANVSGPIGSYMVLNASLRYESKNLTLSLRLNNLFNKAYYVYSVYQQNNRQVFFYPAPEMNWVMTVKYHFL